MQYVGVDHHKKFSYMSIMNEEGIVVKEGRVNNTQEALKRFFGNSDEPKKAVLEAGRNWTVMHDWLEEELGEVKLAHPKKVKAIAEAKIKTDKIDAKILAHLLRADLIPEAYVPKPETRAIKNVLRQRMFFVKLSSMTKNRIHNIIDRYPSLRNQINPSDLFGKQGLEWLRGLDLPNKVDKKLLDEEMNLLSYLTERIKSSNSWITKLGEEDNRVKLLMTIPGIGKFFALLIVSEIDNIERFRNKDKLASYAGLIPSVRSSADRTFYGKIVSHGNRYLRWALIEAAWPAIRKDLHLKLVYQKIRQRKNPNIAKVAVARRLSTIVYRVLSEKRTYITNYPGRPHKLPSCG